MRVRVVGKLALAHATCPDPAAAAPELERCVSATVYFGVNKRLARPPLQAVSHTTPHPHPSPRTRTHLIDMARRSSARLAAATPKRVPLSHDVRNLPRLNESTGDNDDMPGAFPRSVSPIGPAAKRVRVRATTPERTIEKVDARHGKEEEEEEVQWEEMVARTEPAKKSTALSLIGALPGTPTRNIAASERKEWNDTAAEEDSTYQFTFRHREHSLELSPEAKKLMGEKRGEAARIRQEMMMGAAHLSPGSTGNGGGVDMAGRKLATPSPMKKRVGRFSDMHKQQFSQMPSIASHASAFRAQPTPTTTTTTVKTKTGDVDQCAIPSSTLKRSHSKAQLVEPSSSAEVKGVLSRSPSKAKLVAGSALPRATTTIAPPSPSVNVRPSTPQRPKTPHSRPQTPIITTQHSTPARVEEVSTKKTTTAAPGTATKIPLLRSPSKAGSLHSAFLAHAQPQVHGGRNDENSEAGDLARTPVKGLSSSHIGGKHGDTGAGCEEGKQLLARTALHASPSKKTKSAAGDDAAGSTEHGEGEKGTLMARSPLKMSISRPAHPEAGESSSSDVTVGMLARSPVKPSHHPPTMNDHTTSSDPQHPTSTTIPLLSRSPSKLPMTSTSAKPTTTFGQGLKDRFNLLRASPMKMKSILRSPQRLYSDDPELVARGTHMMTPPKQRSKAMMMMAKGEGDGKREDGEEFASVQKKETRVDFSSSTKARDGRVFSTGSTPSTTAAASTTITIPTSSTAVTRSRKSRWETKKL